jgi:hypothetical protein
MKFNEWFTRKLTVDRFPLPHEIEKSNYQYIINVSDEYISYCHNAAMSSFRKYFWFPMNECIGDIGLNSLFGALQILWIAEHENASVLLHCHAGANRSPTVRDAYYFLRTKKHRENIQFDEEIEERLSEFLGGTPMNGKNNRLIDNIEQGHLPSIRKMESFLGYCETQFQKEETHRGGAIDWCKNKSKM